MIPVLDKHKRPLMPCSEKRARQLRESGRAVVHRRRPYIIRLKDRRLEDSAFQPVVLKLDPGSRTTGMAVVREEGTRAGPVHHALHLAEVVHRGQFVHGKMLRRAGARRRRRVANLRHREPRSLNRRRPQGWLAPCLRSRVDNVVSWADRYRQWIPIVRIDIEIVRLDTQKMQDPEISGVEYQQGTLAGYELREYMLEKWKRRCAYCGTQDVPLQIEHVVPKSRRGSNRVSNLTLACRPCNDAKGTKTAAEFGHPQLQAQARKPMAAAATMNTTRHALRNHLRAAGFVVTTWTGGRTKWNRSRFGLSKTHAHDALCVGDVAGVTGGGLPVLLIAAMGRGTRCRTLWGRFGFPRGYRLRTKTVHSFATGDLVRAVVPYGRKTSGVHIGRVAIRETGTFRVGTMDGISWRHCVLLQRADGYDYSQRPSSVPLAERTTAPTCEDEPACIMEPSEANSGGLTPTAGAASDTSLLAYFADWLDDGPRISRGG